MMRVFDVPWLAIASLGAGAVMALLVLSAFRRRLARLTRFGAAELVRRLIPRAVFTPPSWRAARLGAAMLFAVLALAGPRWGEEQAVMRGEGIDIVLALDASLSMMATDERPNRLERMKQEVRRLRASSQGDRFALLAFAGRSYILTPLTVDEGALDLFLDNLDPSVVGQAGSSLSRAIAQGTDLLNATRGAGDKALVVMSDGEAFEDEKDIVDAATKAGDAGIAVVTVGFGTAAGSRIPMRGEGAQTVFKRDENNDIVVTKYHPELLRAAASAAKGTFIGADETDKAAKIRRALESLQASGRTMQGGTVRTPRFQWFVLPALLLLLVDLWRTQARGARRFPTATVATAMLLFAVHGCVLPGNGAWDAARSYNAGRYARAAAGYRAAILQGDRRREMLYNLGTSLVAADSMESAVEPLERTALVDDPDIRYRSLFNLGLTYLKTGLAGDSTADSTRRALDAAIDTYKKALLMHSDDVDAKWNYELALRRRQQASGGGGGGGDANSGGQPQPQPESAEQPSGGLGRQQAEQLLNSAAREERGVQGRKQEQQRQQAPPRGKDW